MACPGGCICGPAVISESAKAKGRMVKENMPNKDRTISSALKDTDYSDVDMDVRHKI